MQNAKCKRKRLSHLACTVCTVCILNFEFCITTAPAQSLVPAGAGQLVVPFENAARESRLFWLSEASAVVLTDDLVALGAQALSRDDRLHAFEQLRLPPVATL